MEKIPLYSVIFKDGSKFMGGTSLFEPKWLEIPNKEIEYIIYTLPSGDQLLLRGYEEYYHYVEAVQLINNKGTAKPEIKFSCIMGKFGDKVNRYKIIQSQSKEYNLGTVVRDSFDINNKAITRLNPRGWIRS